MMPHVRAVAACMARAPFMSINSLSRSNLNYKIIPQQFYFTIHFAHEWFAAKNGLDQRPGINDLGYSSNPLETGACISLQGLKYSAPT
jgi:hypothetical protein